MKTGMVGRWKPAKSFRKHVNHAYRTVVNGITQRLAQSLWTMTLALMRWRRQHGYFQVSPQTDRHDRPLDRHDRPMPDADYVESRD